MTQSAAGRASTPTPLFLYVYALARPCAQDPTVGLVGVEGAEVRCVSDAGLLAIVSDVPAGGFTERALRDRLEDLGRLEDLARAHHAVVEAVAARTTVLPLRLATVYRSERGVREVLRQRGSAFRSAFERVEDRQEWGVKVFSAVPSGAQAERPPSTPVAASLPESRDSAQADSGRAYLRSRLRARREREEAWQRARELTRRVDAVLSTLADDVRHHRPQDPGLSGAAGENVLNAAYLVRRDRQREFIARARELGEREPGARVELTGPWAPYSFALVQGDQRGADEQEDAR